MWHYYLNLYQLDRIRLGLVVLAVISQSLLLIPFAALIRSMFDIVIPHFNISQLLINTCLLLGLYLIQQLLAFWSEYTITEITLTVSQKLREIILKKLYTFSWHYHNQINLGTFHASLVHDIGHVETVSKLLIARWLPALVTIACLSFILIIYNWILFLVMIISVPSSILIGKRLKNRIKNNFALKRQAIIDFSDLTLTALKTIELTRIQTAELLEIENQQNQLSILKSTSLNFTRLQTLYNVLQQIIVTLAKLLLLVVGSLLIYLHQLTLGSLIAFFVAASQFNSAFNELNTALPNFLTMSQSLKTLMQIIQTPDTEPYSGKLQIAFQGSLSFNNVNFQYDERPVLQNLNLKVIPQSIVAIVGDNGAGKSTLIRLLLGFYLPTRGEILIDHYPLSQLDISYWRKNLGVVTQNSVFIPGTIWENLTYGCPHLSMAEVIEATKISAAHDWICHLPNSYHTLIGEEANWLSGGQRQKIAIARALLRRPKFLIFDEPTNHLDQTTITTIMQNLTILPDRPTILLVSHDPTVIAYAHQVYRIS